MGLRRCCAVRLEGERGNMRSKRWWYLRSRLCVEGLTFGKGVRSKTKVSARGVESGAERGEDVQQDD